MSLPPVKSSSEPLQSGNNVLNLNVETESKGPPKKSLITTLLENWRIVGLALLGVLYFGVKNGLFKKYMNNFLGMQKKIMKKGVGVTQENAAQRLTPTDPAQHSVPMMNPGTHVPPTCSKPMELPANFCKPQVIIPAQVPATPPPSPAVIIQSASENSLSSSSREGGEEESPVIEVVNA